MTLRATPPLLTFCLVTVFSLLTFKVHAEQVADQVAPESGQAKALKRSIKANDFIVVSAHPLASQAGYDVLEKGGNAIDAMVSVQTVLGLVEPQSSGMGGGAFLVYFDAKSKTLTTFDGRETAPLKAPADLFMKEDDSPMAFFDAVVGGRSVGTPGTPKLLWELHTQRGTQPWPSLLRPAIELAEKGFDVTPRLANAIARDQARLTTDPTTAAYFFPKGDALKTGDRLTNPDYANTLRALSKHGGDHFYDAAFARDIVDKIKQAENPGYLSLKDFETYEIKERPAECFEYRSFNLCGMGPPSSGAIAVNQTLGILENFDLAALGKDNPQSWHLIAEASRLAFADRGAYVADPDFVDIPKGLMNTGYLKQRASLIQQDRAATSVIAGKPDSPFVPARSPEQDSTTHFVIVDRQGNIVSMTSTIENGFGSRLMVKGFLLNNELTDFSFSPTKNNKLVANRVEPGKRPRSSMAPTIVFRDEKPFLALGSPGGSRIIPYVANSLISILDWNVAIQDAFNQAHIVNRFGTMDLEENSAATQFQTQFEALGYKTSVRNLNSGLHGVHFTKQGMIGAADPRREGTALGK